MTFFLLVGSWGRQQYTLPPGTGYLRYASGLESSGIMEVYAYAQDIISFPDVSRNRINKSQ